MIAHECCAAKAEAGPFTSNAATDERPRAGIPELLVDVGIFPGDPLSKVVELIQQQRVKIGDSRGGSVRECSDRTRPVGTVILRIPPAPLPICERMADRPMKSATTRWRNGWFKVSAMHGPAAARQDPTPTRVGRMPVARWFVSFSNRQRNEHLAGDRVGVTGDRAPKSRLPELPRADGKAQSGYHKEPSRAGTNVNPFDAARSRFRSRDGLTSRRPARLMSARPALLHDARSAAELAPQ
jgi:hypothetical protein